MSSDSRMPQRAKTNGTARLMIFLEAMDHTSTSHPTSQTLCDSLKIVTDNVDRSALLAFAAFTRMIEFAEKEASTHLEAEWDTVGPHFAGIRCCFTPSASGLPWNQRKSLLTASDLTGLRHTAAHLRRFVNEEDLTEADTAELRDAISEMESTLEKEDGISPHSRKVLFERLRTIKSALDEYRFWGIAEVERVYRDFTGTFATDEIVRGDVEKGEKQGSILGKKIIAVVTAFGVMLATANSGVEFVNKSLPTIERMILPAPSAPETPSVVHLKDV